MGVVNLCPAFLETGKTYYDKMTKNELDTEQEALAWIHAYG